MVIYRTALPGEQRFGLFVLAQAVFIVLLERLRFLRQ